jgi:hypothetical protein
MYAVSERSELVLDLEACSGTLHACLDKHYVISYVGLRIILCVADHLVLFEQHACFNLYNTTS